MECFISNTFLRDTGHTFRFSLHEIIDKYGNESLELKWREKREKEGNHRYRFWCERSASIFEKERVFGYFHKRCDQVRKKSAAELWVHRSSQSLLLGSFPLRRCGYNTFYSGQRPARVRSGRAKFCNQHIKLFPGSPRVYFPSNHHIEKIYAQPHFF